MSNGEGAKRVSDQEIMRAVPPAVGAKEFRIGLFVILGVLGFFTVLFLMTDPATFRGRYMITTTVDDAAGIRKGDPVRMRGVGIGRVHRFEMAPQGVKITLEIEGEWGIPAGSRTELVANGMIGGISVAVLQGQGDRLPADSEIPGTAVGGIFESAGDITDDLGTVLGRIETLLSEGTVTDLGASVGSMRLILADLARITDGQAQQVHALTESLNRSASNVEDLTSAPEIGRMLASADSALLTLGRTAASLEVASGALTTVLGRIERGEGTLGQLSVNDSLYVGLNATLGSLRALIDDVRENPSRYITLKVF